MRSRQTQNLVMMLLAGVSLATTVLLIVLLSAKDRSPRSGGVVQQSVTSGHGGMVDLGELPAFELVASDGRAFGKQDMQGRVWVVGFVFTRCTGPCPAIVSRMAVLQGDIGREGWSEGVGLLSVSVDPDHDTCEVLGDYARMAKADPAVWTWLTGARDAVSGLVREGFRLPLSEGGGPIVHSQRLVLVGPSGRVRGYYEALSDDGYAALRADIARLLRSGGSEAISRPYGDGRQARR